MSVAPGAGEKPEPTAEAEGISADGSSSVGDFLRELAFAPPAQPAAPERDRTGETLGHFRLAERLGRGGMGVVHAAFDLTLRRKVALKLLRATAVESEDRRQRLLREARAAAAVSDPHIVTVFEVGEVDGEVFIAMELVEGSDARAWLAARRRTVREILQVFTMAGRGLDAAHRAGLVHRDFKPENILVDGAGRARVADFGLAAGNERQVSPDALTEGAFTGAETVQTGRVQGTPGYIAPEHLAGRELDARADQFAFCVALFEALEGRRPYDALALLALSQGKAASAPRWWKTPRWLRGILKRGLAPEPAGRFSGMGELLSRMERARAWSRRAAVAAWIGAAALALGAVGVRWQASGCEGRAGEVPAAWEAARGPIREAISRVKVPYAADAADRVRLKLDDWTGRWSQAWLAACRSRRAEAVAGCLGRQQADFNAVLSVLQAADTQVVSRAATMVGELEDPDRCVAGDAAPAVVSEEARSVRERLARARALLSAGKYAEGAALADGLRQAGKEVPEAEADALALAALLRWRARSPSAVEALMQARWAAERARRDALSTELALTLCEAHREQGDRVRAEEWLGHAEATLARAGGEPRLESMVLAARARLEMQGDHRIAAHEVALRSLALRERALGPANLEVAESLLLAATTVPFDQLPEGVTLARRALEIRTAALGNVHPEVAAAWEELGRLHADQYARAQALEAHQNALRIRLAALVDGHPDVARAHWNVGSVLAGLGREEDARSHLRTARELLERESPREAALIDLEWAAIEARLGGVEAALERARAALGRLEGALGAESPELAPAFGGVADLLAQHGDLAEAERLYERATRHGERQSRPRLGAALAGMSRLYLARGELARADGAAVASLSARAELYPRNHPELLGSYRALFDVALAKGDVAQAGRHAEQYQSIVNGWLAADDPLRVEAMQVQALLSAAKGDRPGAVSLARAALEAQKARPWQVLRLAEAQGVLGHLLGARGAEGAGLLREATGALRAAKAYGELATERWSRTSPHR